MKKVAILGTVPASRMLAPFTDDEWEIWVCSPGNRGGAIPRVTRWYEIHGIVDLKGVENATWNTHYFEWLRSQPFPVYMQEPNDLVPEAKIFPHRRLLDEFGRLGRLAFTSSISWMIAHAIVEGATEIGVFGVDMAADQEAYTLQKSGCLIMFHIAAERGVKITVPLESCLDTMPPLYGYAEASRFGRRMAVKELEIQENIAAIDQTLERLHRDRNQLAGSLDMARYVRRTFVDGENDAELDLPEIGAEAVQSNPQVVSTATTVYKSPPVVIPNFAEARPETVETDTSQGGVLIPRKRGANNGNLGLSLAEG